MLIRYRTHSMFYTNCFVLCFIAIFVLKERLVLGAKHQHVAVNKVDEFIDKLLTSKKFEELADKIAEKAVDRILELQPNLRITESSKNNFPPGKAVINTTHYTDTHNKGTSSFFKDLSLKYKYFTQSPSENKQSEKNNEISSFKKPVSKTVNDKSPINLENSSENADNDDVSELKDSNTDINETLNIQETRHENKKSKLKKKRIQKEIKNKQDLISAENRKTELDELIENKSDSTNLRSDIENRLNEEKKSDFENMVEHDKDLFDDVSKETTKAADNMKKKRKNRYRKEGNKIYTFMSSSDYDEYHEELERLEKQRKVFA